MEKDFLIRTEFDRFVLSIIPQPVSIPFLGRNGQSYIYTPDFLVSFRANSTARERKALLVEVKPVAEWREHWRDWSTKWKAARRYALDRGWSFRIVDESRIRDQVLANIKVLDRYKRMPFTEDEGLVLLEHAGRSKTITAGDLAKFLRPGERIESMALIWHLVATGRLECQMKVALTEQTVLWIPSHD